MNELYNHTKVKAMVCLTKGEGFGRPLLEFSLTNKPIIASGWSGQVDFLSNEFTVLVGGQLTDVHTSATSKDMILPQAKWFTPDDAAVATAFKVVQKDYKKMLINSKRQGHKSRTEFSYEKMVEVLGNIVTKSVPEFPKQIELKLPELELPKLQKL